MTDQPGLFIKRDGGDDTVHHATHEALGDMQNQSQLTGKYLSALKKGNVSDVLQNTIRERLLAAMPADQRHAYDAEQPNGPKHVIVDNGVQKAETMMIGQAIRHAPGLSQVQNVEMAVRLIQNPKEATTQDWFNLGFVGVSHGMIPREVSEPLSKSLADQSTKFFTGTGTGTFADCQVRLQAQMVAMQPTIHKLGHEAAETGKQIGGWFKNKVIDPTKDKL